MQISSWGQTPAVVFPRTGRLSTALPISVLFRNTTTLCYGFEEKERCIEIHSNYRLQPPAVALCVRTIAPEELGFWQDGGEILLVMSRFSRTVVIASHLKG